jgi:two-component system, LytTR family, sensor kinase
MHNAAFFLKYKLHHVLFWMLVLGLWFYLRKEDYSDPGIAFTVSLLKTADLALMVYLTNYLLIPKLFYRKYYFVFGILFVAMILSSSLLKMKLIGIVLNNPGLFSLSGNLKARIYDNVIPHFFLVLAGAAVKLMYDYSLMQQRMLEMAKEKAEAELNFLKSQINPHFLFNSLNSVYFLIDKENPEARKALHTFSDMLRYQLYEVNGSRIPVEKEIGYLRDYVALQSLRKDDNYQVEFSAAEEVKGFSIEPLLLIPFVENAFKHISHHPEGNNFIRLHLRKEADHLFFTAVNSTEPGKAKELYSGIGLSNVKRRLELLYPGKHVLTIQETPALYTVELSINIV